MTISSRNSLFATVVETTEGTPVSPSAGTDFIPVRDGADISQDFEKLDNEELVSFKELMMANSIQVDALAQLLIERGIFTEDEFHGKLREVMMEYEIKRKGKAD